MGGGDVHTDDFLIEAKSPMKSQKNITIQAAWIDKATEQAFEQNKPYWALAVSFNPEGPDYYVIEEALFKTLVNYLKEEIR
jgi:hypothetical protein